MRSTLAERNQAPSGHAGIKVSAERAVVVAVNGLIVCVKEAADSQTREPRDRETADSRSDDYDLLSRIEARMSNRDQSVITGPKFPITAVGSQTVVREIRVWARIKSSIFLA